MNARTSDGGDTESGADLPVTGIVALLVCGMFPTIGLFSPGLVLPQIERHFAGTPHVTLLTELVGTLASFAFALGAPLAGALVGRLGCRAVLLPALPLFALAGAAPAALDSLPTILMARVVLGLALSGIFTAALAGIGALRADRRMSLFGWFSVVGGASAIVMFPLIGAIGHSDWRNAFLINLLALAAILPALMLPGWLGRAAAGDRQRAADGSGGRLMTPAMARLLLLAAIAGMGMLVAAIYAPLYLTGLGITDTRVLAVPATVGSVAAVLASACYGRLHRALGIAPLWAVAMLAMGIALAMAGISGNIMLFSVAVAINSAMVAIMAPHVSATAMASSPPHLGAQAIGLANGVMFGAQLAFPFIAAWLRGMAGISGLFVLSGLTVAAIGAVMAGRAMLGRARVAI